MGLLTITIRTDNTAFRPEPGYEVARILMDMSDSFADAMRDEGPLHDANGNNVGEYSYDEQG